MTFILFSISRRDLYYLKKAFQFPKSISVIGILHFGDHGSIFKVTTLHYHY